jgi:hypothetical protein
MDWFDGSYRPARSFDGVDDLEGGYRGRSDGKEVAVDSGGKRESAGQ